MTLPHLFRRSRPTTLASLVAVLGVLSSAPPPSRARQASAPPAPAPLVYSTTWLGNRFGGGKRWVQNFAEGMFVSPDGTVYLASGWDEAGREFGVYKNGDVVGKMADTHGWGTGGGTAVTANDKYVFLAHSQGNEGGGLKGETYPAKGKIWFGVSRRNKDGSHAPFAAGRGRFKDMLVLHEENDGTDAQPRGLACDGKLLYVADTSANQIKVFDAEAMTLVKTLNVGVPISQIALDNKAGLWAIIDTNRSTFDRRGYRFAVRRYAVTGSSANPLPQHLDFPRRPDNVVPTAICVDRAERLLIADNGPAQQVLIRLLA